MIKVDKDLNDIPNSLKPATPDFFKEEIPQETLTTHSKRLDVIQTKKYNKSYNNYYKTDDIREKLQSLYHSKCAFCEAIVEQYHIEHYRPKKKKNKDEFAYYWLAFSWDNLLLACPSCNIPKGNKFAIKGKRVSFRKTKNNIKKINTLSVEYDEIEKPLLINPETTNPKGLISFSIFGEIISDDERFTYTIKTCNLDRIYLNDRRKKIYNDLKNEIRLALMENELADQKIVLSHIINRFIEMSNDNKEEFLAFRNYIIEKGWIKDMIKELIAS